MPHYPAMRAMIFHQHGGPEVLRLEDVPTPGPGPTDVLVRVTTHPAKRVEELAPPGWLKVRNARAPDSS